MYVLTVRTGLRLALVLSILFQASCASNVRFVGNKISEQTFAQLPEALSDREIISEFGEPMISGAFNPNRMIYVHEKRVWGFFTLEKVQERVVVIFDVDANGFVVDRQRFVQAEGELPELFQSSASTDVAVRKQSLLRDIFGNIGAVGTSAGD